MLVLSLQDLDDKEADAMISLWTWNDSNGSATKEETMAAYSAITNQGSVSNFSYKVWNDLVDKINEVILNIKSEWITTYGTYLNTKMSNEDKELTAKRFNAAVTNTYYMWWSWVNDQSSEGYTGRKEFHGTSRYGNNSDKVYGQYFVELAEKINVMIHIINDDEYARDANVSLLDQIVCLVECEAAKISSFTLEEIQSCESTSILSNLQSLSQDTVGRLELYFSAELELYDNRYGMTAFIVDVLNTIARMYAFQPRVFAATSISPITANSVVTTDEPTSMRFNVPMGVVGEDVLHSIASNTMLSNTIQSLINGTDINKFEPLSFNTTVNSEDVGEKTMHASKTLSFGNNECMNVLTNESLMTMINIYQAFMQTSIVLVISEVCELVQIVSEPLNVADTLSSITSTLMETLIDPESLNTNTINANTAVAVFELMGLIPMVTNSVQSCSSSNLFELLSPIAFEGSAHASITARGSMSMQYTKLVYATALFEIAVLMQQVLECTSPSPMEEDFQAYLALSAAMGHLMSASMVSLVQINLALSATSNIFISRRCQTLQKMYAGITATAESEMIKRFRSAVYERLLISAGFDTQRANVGSSICNNEMSISSSLELMDNFARMLAESIMSVSSNSNLDMIDTINGLSSETIDAIRTVLIGSVLQSASFGIINNNMNLLIVPELESKILAPMRVDLEMIMACDANFDFEASWDYPDLIGNVLYVRQVKKMEQILRTLYLDAEDNVSELVMHMPMVANIDGWHTLEGICRRITFHVEVDGTLSLTTSSEWIYPINKGNAELSVRQVKSASQTGNVLEVS